MHLTAKWPVIPIACRATMANLVSALRVRSLANCPSIRERMLCVPGQLVIVLLVHGVHCMAR